jgi:hypothetical protein
MVIPYIEQRDNGNEAHKPRKLRFDLWAGGFRKSRRFRCGAAAFQAVSHLSLYSNPFFIEQAFNLLPNIASWRCRHFENTGRIYDAILSILRYAVRRVNRAVVRRNRNEYQAVALRPYFPSTCQEMTDD